MTNPTVKKDYEREIEKIHAPKISRIKHSDTGFVITPGVPDRRFKEFNKKTKEFLLDNTNFFLYDFQDGLGPVYAYKWQNDKGIVSYWAEFDDHDANISICPASTVSSFCKMYTGRTGKIKICGTHVINTELIAKNGTINILDCGTVKNSNFFGAINLITTPLQEKQRFYTNDCEIIQCNITGNNLFYQDNIYTGKMKLTQVQIKGKNEFIGDPDIQPGVQIIDYNKIIGHVEIQTGVQIIGNNYISTWGKKEELLPKFRKPSDDALEEEITDFI